MVSSLQLSVDASHGEALRSTTDLDQSRACDGQFKEEYQPVKAVGRGAFGFVWKATRRSDGHEVRKLLWKCINATFYGNILIFLYVGN